MRAPRGALRSTNPAKSPSRRVQYAGQQPHGSTEDVDLERGENGDPAPGIFRSQSPSGGSVTSEKPHARHDEYAQGYGPPPVDGDGAGRASGQGGHRPIFARTFTQQFRAASMVGDSDLGNLSQKDKEAAHKEERRSYFMDTDFKNREFAFLVELVLGDHSATLRGLARIC